MVNVQKKICLQIQYSMKKNPEYKSPHGTHNSKKWNELEKFFNSHEFINFLFQCVHRDEGNVNQHINHLASESPLNLI